MDNTARLVLGKLYQMVDNQLSTDIPGCCCCCCWSVVVVVMFVVVCVGAETGLDVTQELELKPAPATPPGAIKLKFEATFTLT